MLNQDYPINYGQYKQGLLKTLHFSCREAKSGANERRGIAVDKSGGEGGLAPVTTVPMCVLSFGGGPVGAPSEVSLLVVGCRL